MVDREFDLIARYFRPLCGGTKEALNLADDAAVLSAPAGRDLVVTTDAVVEGVHYLPIFQPEDVAHKVVGVNLSDLAAMGAVPHGIFLAAQLSPGVDADWLAAFSAGLRAALAPSGARLLGGDTVSTPGPQAFTITALGYVGEGRALLRSGARPGDLVFTTGTLGDGALGLAAMQGAFADLGPAHRDYLVGRYARPHPRWAFAADLSRLGMATAAVDISDGLVADLAHLCRASGVTATVEVERILMSDAARAVVEQDRDRMADILTGGDDYEVLFTAPQTARAPLRDLGTAHGLALGVIGRIDDGGNSAARPDPVKVLDAQGQELSLSTSGYQHF